MIAGGDDVDVGELGEGVAGVGQASTCEGFVGGFEEGGAEQTKGSVLIEGGGMACWLWGGI